MVVKKSVYKTWMEVLIPSTVLIVSEYEEREGVLVCEIGRKID